MKKIMFALILWTSSLSYFSIVSCGFKPINNIPHGDQKDDNQSFSEVPIEYDSSPKKLKIKITNHKQAVKYQSLYLKASTEWKSNYQEVLSEMNKNNVDQKELKIVGSITHIYWMWYSIILENCNFKVSCFVNNFNEKTDIKNISSIKILNELINPLKELNILKPNFEEDLKNVFEIVLTKENYNGMNESLKKDRQCWTNVKESISYYYKDSKFLKELEDRKKELEENNLLLERKKWI